MTIDDLGGVTSKLVSLALDAALLRHEVIAHNVANADTPGFAAKKLSFERELAKYMDNGSLNETAFRQDFDELKLNLTEKTYISPRADAEVQLDQEMIRLTQNTLHYRALLEANSKRGAIIRMAIDGARG